MSMNPDLGKRLAVAVLAGLVAGTASLLIAMLPMLFNAVDSEHFNQSQSLTNFLALALQGIIASGFLAATRQLSCPCKSPLRTLQTVSLTALLAIAIPSPAILMNRYADCMILWYTSLVAVAAAWFVLVHKASSDRKAVTSPSPKQP